MNLQIPEGATVQILIGSQIPLPDGMGARAEPRTEAHPRRPLLTGLVAASLLCAAFVLGDRVGARHGATEIANAAPAAPARQAASPPSEQHAFPEHPLPYPPAQQATDIPPAFQRQLQQPPTVVLPPGQPAAPSSRSTRNAFGLEN